MKSDDFDVDALPRRQAHALGALFAATESVAGGHVPTAAEVCLYDEEAVSVKATAAALREAAKRGLCYCMSGYWFVIGDALRAGSIPFDQRMARDLGWD